MWIFTEGAGKGYFDNGGLADGRPGLLDKNHLVVGVYVNFSLPLHKQNLLVIYTG